MIKSLKKIALALGISGSMLIPIALTSSALAVPTELQKNLCAGTNLTTTPTNDACTDPSAGDSRLQSIISTVVNLFSVIVGVVAVVMIVVGGLKYITSGGESGNVTGAKNTILYAIIGLIIVALAQIIVHFVLGKVNPA